MTPIWCAIISLTIQAGLSITFIWSRAAVHSRAAGQPYRALVFCPGTLVQKWQRELEETIPGVLVTQIESWRDVVKLDSQSQAKGPEWFVIGRDRPKLGSCWQTA